MTTSWTEADVSKGFDAYRDLPEQILGYETLFDRIGLGGRTPVRILDYGCGPGKVAARLAERGAVVTAVDVSEEMLKIARTRRAHPNIEYRRIEGGDLSSLAGSGFDAAITCYVMINNADEEHIRRIMRSVHDVLAPGGSFFVLDTNPDTTGIEFSTFRSGEAGQFYGYGAPRKVWLRLPDGSDLILDDHHWPKEMYLSALEAAGFMKVDIVEPTLGDVPPDRLARFERDNPGIRWRSERSAPPFVIFHATKAGGGGERGR